MTQCRYLALLFGLLVVMGCNSPTVEENEHPPEASAESAADSEYGAAFLNLMLEFKVNAEKANEELDEAEAKGLPEDRKARRAVLIELMDRNDRRSEELLAKAQQVRPTPLFEDFHGSVMRFLTDFVKGNVRYTEAVKKRDPNASKISDEGTQTMIKNYDRMKLEGERLGIKMPDLGL